MKNKINKRTTKKSIFVLKQISNLSNSFVNEIGICVLKDETFMENYFFGELRSVINELYKRIKTSYYPTLEMVNNEKNINELKAKYANIKKEYNDYFYDVEILKSIEDAENYTLKLKGYYDFFKNYKINS